MKLRVVSNKSTVSAVVEQIRRLVEDGTLSAGDRLPTELELVEQLGVSRTVLREAICRLEAIGLLTVRRGRGMFIGDRHSLANCVRLVRSAMAITPGDLIQFTEFRRAVECYAAQRAAERANPADLLELEALCLAIDSPAHDDLAAMGADLQFHLKIIELTGNELMRGILEIVQEFSLAAMAQTTPKPRDRDESRRRHLAIVRAIGSGDPRAADAAMQSHFEHTLARLKQSPAGDQPAETRTATAASV